MKYLHTCKTRPHRFFNDITDDELRNYAKEEFDLTLNSLTYIKDIINVYSYLLLGDNAKDAFLHKEDIYMIDKFEFSISDDMDVLNMAFSVYVKLAQVDRTTVGITSSYTIEVPAEVQRFKQQLIELDLFGIVHKRERFKMSSYSSVVSIPSHNLMLPDFSTRFARKKYDVVEKHNTKEMSGYLYIDFSASVLSKNLVLFKLFRDNLPFNAKDKVSLHLFSVTTFGIQSLGKVSSYKEFMRVVNSTRFKAGSIDVSTVLAHTKTHRFKSTFVTDAEDFSIEDNLRNINIITINGHGRIKHIK